MAFWRGMLAAAVVIPQWRADLARHLWTAMDLDGEDLRGYLGSERADMRGVLAGLGLLRGRSG